MWSDNETTTDLIGFKVHADLVREVATDSSLLPVVLGVFGDWGGGKSSIMRMLQQQLDAKHEDIVCLYFNGWMFEGYEDAKTALLTSILIQLGEHERFGQKIRGKITGLLKRVKLMELAKLGIKHGLPLAIGALTGDPSSLLLATGLSLSSKADSSETTEQPAEDKDTDKTNWTELIQGDPSKPDLLDVRRFRDDFEKMLAETNIKSLVVLIDDLDRCLPERIIETLEAIKLFVAVPKTAFVIGADPRIVRHAIATRYVARQVGDDSSSPQEEYDLVQDYLEKLIQIPYYLPRLSPAEVETYINLLACQKHLPPEKYTEILDDWASKRTANFYAAYQYGAVKAVLGNDGEISEALEQQLVWSNAVAPVITEGLKGNPRQVKRMLNAMLLRKQLAKVVGIDIRDEVLAKLMVLEYTHLPQFHELHNWQASENGYPERLKQLESWALAEEDKTISLPESLNDWNRPTLAGWVRMQPALSDIDLRDYFWLARDRTHSTLTGVNMVPPFVRRLLNQLISGNDGEQHIAAREAAAMDEPERAVLLQLLQKQIERHPDQLSGPAALYILAEEKIQGAGRTLLTSVKNANVRQLDPGIAFRIQAIGKNDPSLAESVRSTLEFLQDKKDTRIGKAAAGALK